MDNSTLSNSENIEPELKPIPEGSSSTDIPQVDSYSPKPRPSEKPLEKKQEPFNVFGSIQAIVTYAFLLATLFTLFSPNNLFSGDMFTKMFQAWQANPTNIAPVNTAIVSSNTNHIGIVVGHWKNDSGSLCENGLTEVEVNLKIANLVQQKLSAEGFQVDLLEEFDSRLSQYKGIVLLSIHADTCDYISDDATGFKVAAALYSTLPEKATRLTSCMVDRYSKRTGLAYHTSITEDMTSYHAFNEINSDTTAAIIETGFLNLDQQILTQNPDLIAQGIVDGLLCFIRNESIASTPTPEPQ